MQVTLGVRLRASLGEGPNIALEAAGRHTAAWPPRGWLFDCASGCVAEPTHGARHHYVFVDAFYGSSGGPPGKSIEPGSEITLTDPRTGTDSEFTVAGVISDGTAFYRVTNTVARYLALSVSAGRESRARAGRISSPHLADRSA